MQTSFKTLFSKKATIWRLKESPTNFCKKSLSVTTWNKKHSSKQVVSSTYTLQFFLFCFFFGFFCSCSLWRFASRFDLNRITNRSKHRRCSVRKGVLRNFAKFTEKHMCQSLFFNKVADCRAVGARGAKGDCPALQLFEYCCCLLTIVKRNWRKLKF